MFKQPRSGLERRSPPKPCPSRLSLMLLLAPVTLWLAGCQPAGVPHLKPFDHYALDYDTATDRALQARLQTTDARLRNKYGMTTGQTAVGVLDLKGLRLAMIHPVLPAAGTGQTRLAGRLTDPARGPRIAGPSSRQYQVRERIGRTRPADYSQMGFVARLVPRLDGGDRAGPALRPGCPHPSSARGRIPGRTRRGGG